jgi:hypothetical protein
VMGLRVVGAVAFLAAAGVLAFTTTSFRESVAMALRFVCHCHGIEVIEVLGREPSEQFGWFRFFVRYHRQVVIPRHSAGDCEDAINVPVIHSVDVLLSPVPAVLRAR